MHEAYLFDGLLARPKSSKADCHSAHDDAPVAADRAVASLVGARQLVQLAHDEHAPSVSRFRYPALYAAQAKRGLLVSTVACAR